MGATTPATGYGNVSRHAGALSGLRICDLPGQLAGAGATRTLAAFGAQVIRIEDQVTKGLWDIVRQMSPVIDDDRSHEGGAGTHRTRPSPIPTSWPAASPRTSPIRELGQVFTYRGAPSRFAASPWEIRHRAPMLGAKTTEVTDRACERLSSRPDRSHA